MIKTIATLILTLSLSSIETLADDPCIDPVLIEQVLGPLLPARSFSHIEVHEDLVFIGTSNDDRFYIFNTSGPGPSFIESDIRLGRSITDMAIDYPYVFVAAEYGGTHIIDVSDSSNPIIVSTIALSFGNRAISISLDGNNLFVLEDRAHRINLYDVSDKSSPTLQGFIQPSGTPWSISSDGRFVYTTGYQDPCTVYDFTNPNAPLKSDEVDLSGAGVISGSVKHGNTLFSMSYGKMYAIDVSDPYNIYFLYFPDHLEPSLDNYYYHLSDSSDSSHGRRTMQVVEENESTHIFIGTTLDHSPEDDGLIVVDITNIDAPQTISIFNTREVAAGRLSDLAIHGSRAYIAHGISGFLVIDISNNCLDCIADINNDGILDFFDVSDFLDFFAVEDPQADFDGNGIWDFFDVSGFLDAFGAGCP